MPKIIHGDSYIELAKLKENSVDSIVCDPPYMIGFMGKKFDDPKDNVAADPEFWKLVLKVLKPGGHLLAFGGTRTYHRMAVAIEDSGFEIRDQLMWVYGSGFPKSLNIGKAVDKLQGNEREDLGEFDVGYKDKKRSVLQPKDGWNNNSMKGVFALTKGTSEWEGFGTGLKPAHEPICLARKPLSEKTIVENVLKWGTGGINIGGCRIEANDESYEKNTNRENVKGHWGNSKGDAKVEANSQGRFPSNFILSCECEEVIEGEVSSGGGLKKQEGNSVYGERENVDWHNYADKDGKEKTLIHTNPECPAFMLDQQSGERKVSGSASAGREISGGHRGIFGGASKPNQMGHNDKGGASRFFLNVKGDRFKYVAKASKRERNKGCEGLEGEYKSIVKNRKCKICGYQEVSGSPCRCEEPVWRIVERKVVTKNHHPTVKPLKLMRYLCRLITPPNGTVLDPFMGSGSTGIAAKLEGFGFIGIEMEEEYVEIGKARIEAWEPDPQGELF